MCYNIAAVAKSRLLRNGIEEHGSTMVGISWSQQMSVGVPALDSDHQALLRILNLLDEIRDTPEADGSFESVLDSLIAYSRYHFAREEQVMEACGFSEIDVHRGEHVAFAKYVTGLRERRNGGGHAAQLGELLDYLTDWLRHHILIQDMAFKPFVMGRDLGSVEVHLELMMAAPA